MGVRASCATRLLLVEAKPGRRTHHAASEKVSHLLASRRNKLLREELRSRSQNLARESCDPCKRRALPDEAQAVPRPRRALTSAVPHWRSVGFGLSERKEKANERIDIASARSDTTLVRLAQRRQERARKTDPAGSTRIATPGPSLHEPGTARPHLQTTALLNDAYLKLSDKTHPQWQNRAHFFAVAAQLMRRIMVDHARHRQAFKRGGGALRVDARRVVSRELRPAPASCLRWTKRWRNWRHLTSAKSDVVEMRYFGGLTMEEIAEVMKIHVEYRDAQTGRAARAWLFAALSGEGRGCNLRDWQNCTDIFDAVLDCSRGGARGVSYRAMCAAMARLRRKLNVLLKYHEQIDGFIESPAFETAPELVVR